MGLEKSNFHQQHPGQRNPEPLIEPVRLFLGCGRKPVWPQEPHTSTGRAGKPEARTEPRSFPPSLLFPQRELSSYAASQANGPVSMVTTKAEFSQCPGTFSAAVKPRQKPLG